MDASIAFGSIGFGMVIGWVTYYTMRKNTKERTLADITVIISALIGPAVLAVFPAPAEGKPTMFGYYGIGLALGFFLYYIIFVLILWKAPARLRSAMIVTEVVKEEGKPQKVDPGIMDGPNTSTGRE
jgi:TRAP-type C4-dicarboxylate transport system permease small subunit